MSFPPFVELKSSDVKTIYSTNQGFPLGTRGFTQDGRVFRWALNGATALTMGVPVMTAGIELLEKDTELVSTASFINDTEDISTTWRSFTVETEQATGAITADDYADGFVRVANSTASNAKGQLVRIKSNDASATSSTDALGSTMTITFADDDKLTAALDTGAIVTLHHNAYWKTVVVAGAATQNGIPLGVPVRPVTAAYYYWLQTWGPCAVLQDGTLLTGEKVIVSTSTSDAIALAAVTTSTEAYPDDIIYQAERRPTIGWAMGSPGTDAYFGMIFLTIAP